MENPAAPAPDDPDYRAILASRNRVAITLTFVVVAGYAALILLMAFAPQSMAAPAGLAWSFAYCVLTVAVMIFYVWYRTRDPHHLQDSGGND